MSPSDKKSQLQDAKMKLHVFGGTYPTATCMRLLGSAWDPGNMHYPKHRDGEDLPQCTPTTISISHSQMNLREMVTRLFLTGCSAPAFEST
jgi:hypothetical protein